MKLYTISKKSGVFPKLQWNEDDEANLEYGVVVVIVTSLNCGKTRRIPVIRSIYRDTHLVTNANIVSCFY